MADLTENGTGRMLARIEERVIALDDKMDGFCDRTEKCLDDHEKRLRETEKQTLWTQIVGSVVAFAFAGWSALVK
jgi:hypothetical protein